MRLQLLILLFLLPLASLTQQKAEFIIYFNFNEETPTENSVVELKKISAPFKDKEVISLTIEGHTDIKGSKEYNDQLSARRSNNIRELLKDYFPSDVPVSLSSFGKEKLLTTAEDNQEINRRVRITVVYKEKTQPHEETVLQPLFEDVEVQKFRVNLDDTIIVTGKEGTIIKISPGSIQHKDGKPAVGWMDFYLKEYYRPGDILLSGLNTTSDFSLLETGGMFNILLIREKDTMSASTLKPISIRMPVVNNPGGVMNVFVRDTKDSANNIHGRDTVNAILGWKNTDSVFNRLNSYWDWPDPSGKLIDWIYPYIKFENWRVGQKYTEEYYLAGRGIFGWGRRKKNIAKKISEEIRKTDSITLVTTIKLRFRKRGLRKYNTRNFDTTFTTRFRRQEYIGFTYNLNWINCDRFLKYPEVSNYYVATPEFNGANVMVWFKSQNAFMQAKADDNNLYKVSNVPPGEKVWVVALGKKDNEYYLGKKEAVISATEKTIVSMAKISKEDLHKEMKSF